MNEPNQVTRPRGLLVFLILIVSLIDYGPAFSRAMDSGHDLQIEILPQFNGASLAFDSVTNQLPNGQLISVTRLDFLMSSLALRRADGSWLALTNWEEYLS